MSEILRLERLSKYYTNGQNVVMGLSEISLSFSTGEFVAITGASGSGKSTLASVLGGILPYESGEMYLAGRPTSHYDGSDRERMRRDFVSYISQSYGLLPGCSVMENVMSALRISGCGRKQARQRAGEILREVELWEVRSRRAAKLSSGQKQRLSIARALAKSAPILIADEPTGNLDPDNSAKIIELLRRASGSRLVILITHEFSEAEHCATRHIALQDGRVVLDAPLRPAAEAAPLPLREEKAHRGLGLYTARLQLMGRPVWSALLAAFFALTAFGVFAFTGTFITNLDDTSTRIYDNSAFRNGSKTRLVVMRGDYEPMTETDYQAILGIENVVALEPWGSLNDINYAYREGVDFDFAYAVETTGGMHDMEKNIASSVKMRDSAPFMQTVPLLSQGEFLSAGRLPENIYEVVAKGDPEQIGSTVDVYIQDAKNWSTSMKVPLTLEIVGVTDYGSGLYFHGDLGRGFGRYYDTGLLALYSSKLPDDIVQVSEDAYPAYIKFGRATLQFSDLTRPSDEWDDGYEKLELKLICEANGNEDIGISPTHNSYLSSYVLMSRDSFNRVTSSENSTQAGLRISDYAYTDEVIEDIRAAGYVALSPFREGSTKQNPTLVQQREQTLSVCAGALLALVLLQILVLRGLFVPQNETFRLLGNIGLQCRDARRSIWWQCLLFTALGQGIALIALIICREMGVERIVDMLRYLPGHYMALLSAIHLAAAAWGAGLVSRAVARQIFPSQRTKFDLKTEVDEA